MDESWEKRACQDSKLKNKDIESWGQGPGGAEEGQSLEGFLQTVPFKVGTGEGVSYCFFITFGTAL